MIIEDEIDVVDPSHGLDFLSGGACGGWDPTSESKYTRPRKMPVVEIPSFVTRRLHDVGVSAAGVT